MRRIEIEPDLHLTFPGQGEAFDEGIEVGLAIASMAHGMPIFERRICAGSLEQLRVVADKLGYTLVATPLNGDGSPQVGVVLSRRGLRPRLRLIG